MRRQSLWFLAVVGLSCLLVCPSAAENVNANGSKGRSQQPFASPQMIKYFNAPDEKSLKDKVLSKMNFLKTPLQTFATGINALAGASSNKYNMLHALNKILINAGPTLMVVGMALSIITAFLPQPDSKELAFMKEKFDVVINGLNRVENKLSDLEKLVMHESTKTAYGEYQRSIQNLFMDWQYAVNATTKKEEERNRAIFVKQYELHYKHASLNLLKAMTGQFDGELNNDLLTTAKERYKCDGMKLRKLCSAVLHTINQGLAVEGAYYTYTEVYERADREGMLWKERMELLSNTCDAIVTDCRGKWKEYALPPMWDAYHKYKTASHEVLAAQVFNALYNNFGQRAWFVFVYNSVMGYEYHGYAATRNESIAEDIQTKWRENEKMFTVVSLDMDVFPAFKNQVEVNKTLESLRGAVSSCKSLLPGEQKLAPAYTLLKVLTEFGQPYGLAVYAVKTDLKLVFHGTEHRYMRTKLVDQASCQRGAQYNFDLISMG